MNYYRLFIALAVLINMVNCSTISTTRQATSLSSITSERTYQLRVRSGNLALDKIIHDYASMKFGQYLQINRKGQSTNCIEIVFLNSVNKGFSGSASGHTVNMVYGNSWYTGDDNPWLNNYSPALENEIAPGSVFSWINSTIVVVIKDVEGKILWKSHYNYKGNSELSGLYVKTSDEAARLSLDRIIRQFEMDYITLSRSAKFPAQNIIPGIALIIEEEAPVLQENSVNEGPIFDNVDPLFPVHELIPI